jgi:hypothetical protein
MARSRPAAHPAPPSGCLAFRQVKVGLVRVQLELQPRMFGAQPRKCGQQDPSDVRIRARHAHTPLEPCVLPREPALEPRHLPLHSLRSGQHVLARVGEQIALAIPIEQLHPEPCLERLHPPRDRRMTHPGDRIVGRTPIGRATVIALRLNRPSLVAARRSWVSVGWIRLRRSIQSPVDLAACRSSWSSAARVQVPAGAEGSATENW